MDARRFIQPALLAASGQPLLAQGDSQQGQGREAESELLTYQEVGVYIGETKVYRGGACVLTSHRLIWSEGGQGHALALADIKKLETRAGFMGMSSPKITIYLRARTDEAPPQPDYLYLSFAAGDRDAFLLALQSAVDTEAWVVSIKQREEFSTSRAGVGGVLRHVDRAVREGDAALQAAFTDMEALMANAKDLVRLAERWAASEEGQGNKDQMNAMLHNMGIPSPVTRKSAGSTKYHSELARQLGTFIEGPLQRAGGTMTLTAAFCVFNRARGTELISPEDMTHACGLFPALHIPIRMVFLASGFGVLQSEGHSGEAITLRIVEAITGAPARGMAPVEVSRELVLPLLLTKQYVLAAERRGLLCRDETLEGIRFYPNLFASF